jgi:hypothetical protein
MIEDDSRGRETSGHGPRPRIHGPRYVGTYGTYDATVDGGESEKKFRNSMDAKMAGKVYIVQLCPTTINRARVRVRGAGATAARGQGNVDFSMRAAEKEVLIASANSNNCYQLSNDVKTQPLRIFQVYLDRDQISSCQLNSLVTMQ